MRAVAALLAMALASGAAGAQAPRFHLDWSAPEGCPTAEDVVSRAERLLGRPLPEAAPADLRVRARLEPSGEHWQLHLSQTSSAGAEARDVSAPACAELGDAAALLIALSIDPTVTGTQSENMRREFPSEAPPPPQPPLSAANAPPVPPAAPRSEPQRPPSTRAPEPEAPWRVAVGASLAAWSGRLPGLSPGALAHVATDDGRWLLLAELGFFPSRHAEVDGAAAGGDLLMASGGGQLGYILRFGRAAVAPIAGVELEWAHGAGSGVDHPDSADALLVAFQGGARLSLEVSRAWGLIGTVQFSTLANRPRFVLDGIGPVFQPDPWGLRFGVGAEWRRP
jgi:hypothetical protein